MSIVVDAVIAARDAAVSLAQVIEALPARRLRSVVVVDRDSSDSTAQVARDAGAVVLRIRDAGYGAACRRAISHLESLPRPPDAVVFVAADGSDPAADIGELIDPLERDNAELVIGVRDRADQAVEGRVALGLIGMLYRHRFSDISPLCAIRFPALVALAVGDTGSGWVAEMLVKAVRLGLQIVEVPVSEGRFKPAAGKAARLARTSRMVFRILRHATAR